MYESYKIARDMSWQALIDCKISSLPVDLALIAETYGFPVIPYSKTPMAQAFSRQAHDGDGFIVEIADNTKYIFINDKIKYRSRRRFTLAHEIGHGVLNHDVGHIHFRNSEIDSATDIQEMQANVFARGVLMPATVLRALNARTPDDIVALCNVSRKSAEIRAERLKILYERGKFGIHPLEKQVLKQFSNFIDEYKENNK